jgi:hypothetical protein
VCLCSLGDAESSLGDAKSSLGDAESSLGDAKSSLSDARSSLGDAKSCLGDAESSLGDAESAMGDAESSQVVSDAVEDAGRPDASVAAAAAVCAVCGDAAVERDPVSLRYLAVGQPTEAALKVRAWCPSNKGERTGRGTWDSGALEDSMRTHKPLVLYAWPFPREGRCLGWRALRASRVPVGATQRREAAPLTCGWCWTDPRVGFVSYHVYMCRCWWRSLRAASPP